MKIHPTEDRLLIKPLEGDDVSAGGILIPDVAKEKQGKGEVVALGPGKLHLFSDCAKTFPLEFKVGQVVLYGKYAGTPVKDGRDEYILIRASDISACITE